jgi:hypothetical protein
VIAPGAARFLARVAFALWVSICSAAPEFIWQGLLQLGGHLTLFNLYAVMLIGPILAFFVEPILQRIRSRRWDVDEHGGQGVLASVVFALAFGVAAVAVHECMNAYVGGGEHLQSQRRDSLGRAVDLILQWALVPFGVTLAWFGARHGRRLGGCAAALAFLWAVAVGWHYEWDWRDIAVSAVLGGLIGVFGVRRIARGWSHDTFRELAFGTGLLVVGFTSVGLLVQLPLSLAGVTSWHVYNFRELFEDLRFYLGWVLGLLIAPNPVPEELSGRDAPSHG